MPEADARHSSNERPRVVVTGMGVMSPIGCDLSTFWTNLRDGVSGVAELTRFDATEYTSRIAGEVRDFDPTDYLDAKDAKRTDRFTQLAVAASLKALRHARLTINDENADDVGVFIGSGIGGMATWEQQYEILLSRGPRRVSPFLVPMMISNMAAGFVAIVTGARGPNAALVTACASSTHAIGDAYETIRRGDARAMIAGGSEAGITRSAFAGFCSAKTLSRRNDDPAGASRPFDAERDGFVMAEGSGVVILERWDDAVERGATIRAEIIGYGMSGDAYHVTAPSVDGPARAMREALDSAGLQPSDVDFINAHGTSTPTGDPAETAAIKAVFGDDAHDVPVSANKSMLGHLLGAAGAVELAASILSLEHQIITPTINYTTPDAECDLDYVPNEARAAALETVLSNSFGFGGQNACLVVRRFQA
jgi:3-oxoacyl-[acyl-carrier-protein] synthase II